MGIEFKSRRKILIAVFSIIILSNIPPFKWPFTWFDHDDYRFSTNNGSFTFQEFQFKNRDFAMGRGRFLYFKNNCRCNNTILYRLNKNNLLKFWRYGDYIFKKKYRLPYESWENIEARRGYIDHLQNQDF